MTQVEMPVMHNLLFAGFEDEVPGVIGIAGNCSCSAWFDMRIDAQGQLLFLVQRNNFPPCPAVWPLMNHFKREIE